MKGAGHLLLSQSTLKQLPWEGLLTNLKAFWAIPLNIFISLIVEELVEEAPRRELVFVLKHLLWESLTNKF